ncbi:MAG: vitamin K epoxide reductase family protein [Chloroflexota bacterium]|nr:vitamin K epoxide reductase family protein [Chloroflexota bacterium]MDE3192812.1 vitamin K epoxide reductase family protein [Chloroflexota bacterium]
MRTGPDRTALAALALGIAGVAVSGYLTVVHYGGVALACQQSSLIDCEAVTTSSYSLIPGTDLPVSLAGLAWALVVVGLASALLSGARGADVILLVWSAVAMIPVLYLVWAEIVIVHRICLWCTVFHAIVLGTLLAALVRLQGAAALEEQV